MSAMTGLSSDWGLVTSDREIFAGWLWQPVKLGYILQSDTIDQIEFRGALCDTMCRVGAEIGDTNTPHLLQSRQGQYLASASPSLDTELL